MIFSPLLKKKKKVFLHPLPLEKQPSQGYLSCTADPETRLVFPGDFWSPAQAIQCFSESSSSTAGSLMQEGELHVASCSLLLAHASP